MVVTILESNDNVILFVENVGKFADFLFYFTLMFASDVVFGVFRKIAERTRFLDLFDGVASAFVDKPLQSFGQFLLFLQP